ncbi:hypothetical protein KY284_020544 [Solanum tuberosum]|nr:hypothetical protein KY284_020544 [Solanum tuberosum]
MKDYHTLALNSNEIELKNLLLQTLASTFILFFFLEVVTQASGEATTTPVRQSLRRGCKKLEAQLLETLSLTFSVLTTFAQAYSATPVSVSQVLNLCDWGNKGDIVVVPWTVKCIHCGRVTYYHSHNTGTTSLRRHVKRCLENRNQNRHLSRIDD